MLTRFPLAAFTTALAGPSLLLAALIAPCAAQDDTSFLRQDVLGRLPWRSLGPPNFGGRIVDIAVDPKHSATFYAATGSGGVWKTLNNGFTWKVVFERERANSIGDIAVAPSNGDILYVGTGEANNQRSSYWGDGVYKSTDAGKTWVHVGLPDSEHIGRIAIHPSNPDIVFVAALGALYTANPERGLFRTTDGGKTWKCVKAISADVGFVDVAIDPKEPQNIYGASYERRRRPHHLSQSGPGSALWRSQDGGETWTKMAGGLPSGELGRIGLDLFAANPKILVATIENRNPAPEAAPEPKVETDPREPKDGDSDVTTEPQAASAPDEWSDSSRRRVIGGEVYRSEDAGTTWRKINNKSVGGEPGYYYGQIRIDPKNDQIIYVLSVPVHVTLDGGKTWKQDLVRGIHVDHHALWIDPQQTQRLLLGNDGGVHQSYDRGKTWDHYATMPIGQFYAVGVDMRSPYWVYGGTQDNGTWGIPSAPEDTAGLTRNHARRINGGDGFYVCVDPTNPNIVYSESQFGAVSRLDLSTGARRMIRPSAQRGQPALRFNWMTPILLSPHDPQTVYVGSQYLHRSKNRGDRWETISPDLTRNDPDKLKGNVPHCTITTIAESAKQDGLLYVGTDDGKVWLSKNGGQRWVDLSDRFPALPKPLWVSRIETSHFDANLAYVTFTGYREDLRTPFLYMTSDGGETFVSIAGNLPSSPINVVREHPRNPKVLLVGNEHGVQVSVDAGATWHPLGKESPTVAVHDLVVHPRESDLILGTHGRGIYIVDIAILEDLSEEVLAKPFHAFKPRDGQLLRRAFGSGYGGSRRWAVDPFDPAAKFAFYLREDSDQAVTVKVMDATGKVLYTKVGDKRAGLQTVTWPAGTPGGRGGPGGGGPMFGARGRTMPGEYAVEFSFGEQTVRYPFRLAASAGWIASGGFGAEDESELESTPRETGR